MSDMITVTWTETVTQTRTVTATVTPAEYQAILAEHLSDQAHAPSTALDAADGYRSGPDYRAALDALSLTDNVEITNASCEYEVDTIATDANEHWCVDCDVAVADHCANECGNCECEGPCDDCGECSDDCTCDEDEDEDDEEDDTDA